ncbi:uncharacterized protein LOC143227564 [Tachypleus tridentatus]|uniref:uncharacterized protein LOC143227564 n=1 Tax=Tachypleus tridentatus TaxID=6853 RepID=UPI003FD61175
MKVRPFISVFGCFLIYLGLGTTFLFGNITPYLTSYLRKRVNNNTRYEQTAWIIYVSDCLTSFFFCGVWLAERIGHRFSILIGTVIYSLGIIATYWTIQHSLGYNTLGMVVNVGFIGCYGFPLSVAMQVHKINHTAMQSPQTNICSRMDRTEEHSDFNVVLSWDTTFQQVNSSNFCPARDAPVNFKCCYCEVKMSRRNNSLATKR